jgi:hypothetical protein
MIKEMDKDHLLNRTRNYNYQIFKEMPNYVTNKLTILSNDEKIMDKIKKVLLVENNNGTKSVTMSKLLPPPKDNCDIAWSRAAWGTKWDMFNSSINVNDKEKLYVSYDTAWCPNAIWIMTLCRYIQSLIDYMLCEKLPDITVEHHYYDALCGGFGGFLKWSPNSEIVYIEFDIMEYMYNFNKPYHDWLAQEIGYEPFNPTLKRFEEFCEKYCLEP